MNEIQIRAYQTLYNAVGIPFLVIGYDGTIHFAMPYSYAGYFIEEWEKNPPDRLKDSNNPGGLTLLEAGEASSSIICKLDDDQYMFTAPIRSSANGFVYPERIRQQIRPEKFREYLSFLRQLPVLSMYRQIACASLVKYIHSGFLPEGLNYYQIIEHSNGMLKPDRDRSDELCIEEDHQKHPHTAEEQRKKMLDAVRNGNAQLLEEALRYPYFGYAGQMSSSPVQQARYAFVMDLDQAVQTAIRAGSQREYCLDLFDSFCRQLDQIDSVNGMENFRCQCLRRLCGIVSETLQNSSFHLYTRQAISFVAQNITGDLSVQNISAHLAVNRNLLAARFKEDTGTSLHAYAVNAKLEKAKQLLKDREMSIADISDILSFSSQSHFTKLFRDQYGMTPLQYRMKEIGE